jgi:hypothetical protein
MASNLSMLDFVILLVWVLSVGLFWLSSLLFAAVNLLAAPIFDRLDHRFQREIISNPFLPGLPDQLVWDQVFEGLRWQIGPLHFTKFTPCEQNLARCSVTDS